MLPSQFQQRIDDDLTRRDRQAMRRRLTPINTTGKYVERQGKRLLNLASNDYLALSDHEHLKNAAARAAQALGTGATASRLVVGHTELHQQVETRFAQFKHAEAALIFPTGYMANLATLSALTRPGDLLCLDKLNHASLIDAARNAPAELRIFAHHQYEKLERLLQRFEQTKNDDAIAFIVTDAVFSMDGDVADLLVICELADRYGAMVIVDEAHGTGVLGQQGTGLCEQQGISDRVDVVISTASKALGSLGGIVTAGQSIIDTLINHARSFIYTTAVPPPQLASIDAALDVIHGEPQRREHLQSLCKRAATAFGEQGWALPPRRIHTPIFPLIVGSPEAALEAATQLEAQGILAIAIRPPTVAPGTSRVRLSLRADLTNDELDRVLAATAALKK